MNKGFRRRCKPIKFARAKYMRSFPTKSEAIIWDELRNKKLDGFKFRRQAVMLGFIADFYCPSKKLVVEIDGSSHIGKELSDQQRDRILSERLNIKTLRITSDRVFSDVSNVLNEIRLALSR